MSSIQNTNDLIEFTDHADSIDKSAGTVVQIVQNMGEMPAHLIAAAVAKITTAAAATNKSAIAINKSESGSCESPDLIASPPATVTAAAADIKTLPQVCIYYIVELMFSSMCTNSAMATVNLFYYESTQVFAENIPCE